jgi:hypothetical protein
MVTIGQILKAKKSKPIYFAEVSKIVQPAPGFAGRFGTRVNTYVVRWRGRVVFVTDSAPRAFAMADKLSGGFTARKGF